MNRLSIKLLQRINHNRNAAVAVLLLVLTLLFLSRIIAPPVGQAAGSHDMRGLFYPWLQATRESLLRGQIPFWDRLQFAGYPFLSNPQVALFYPLTWLAILFPVNWGISWYLASHVWWAGLGMYLFVRNQRSSWSGAILSALAFAFSGFVAARIGAGHMGLLAVNSWLPWLLLACAWSIKQQSISAGIVSGVPFGLAILAGHTASLLYVGMAWFLFAMYLAWHTGRPILVFRQLFLALLAGLSLSAVQLLPLWQFSQVSTRAAETTFEFASAFSFPPAHLVTLLVPEFFGEPTRAGYWSVPNFEELTYYAGILPLLGVMLALKRPSRLAWFLVGLLVLGLLLAFGSYGFLFPLAYELVPLFRMARAPGRAAVLFTFAASASLAIAITAWETRPSLSRRFWNRLLAITIAAGFLAMAAAGAVFAAQHPSETSGRLWHQLGGWTLALLFTVMAIALLRTFLLHPGRRFLAGLGLIALSVADLWTFGFKLVRLESMDPIPMWTEAKAIIGETESRVLPWGISIFDQNGAGQVGLASVFGYNALEISTNTAFAASVPDPRSTAYDVLAVEYVIAQVPLKQYTDGERPLEEVERTDHVWVYRRGRPLPLARLVYQWEVIADENRAISRVHEPDFDPSTTVILDRSPACAIFEPLESPGVAQVTEVRNGYWRMEVDTSSAALLVLSETYYPGWRVRVSGEQSKMYKAYTTIRAVCVPAGSHTVEWEYVPTIYGFGGAITLAATIATGICIIRLRRESVKDDDALVR